MLRVYTACTGVLNSSFPSRKNGRFSGKKMAKRSLVEITAASDSTCEKSGFNVASMAMFCVGVHFTSMPPSPFTGRVTMFDPSPSRVSPIDFAVVYGAMTMCPPGGRPCNPLSLFSLQMKQFEPRGILLANIW